MIQARPRLNTHRLMLVLAFILLALCLPGLALADTPRVRLLQVDGTITPAMREYVDNGLRQANHEHDSAVLIEINSPGGLQAAATGIHRAIRASSVPVIAYVTSLNNQGITAESQLTSAAAVAASAPGAVPRTGIIAKDKSDLLRIVDGRRVTTPSGQTTLRTRGATIVSAPMATESRFRQFISNSTLAYVLFSLGLLGLVFEIANPGTIVPGVAGGILTIAGLYGLAALGVSWAGIALICAAFVLFVVDIYMPSHGMLTIGGLVAFALGSLMLMNSHPSSALHISKFAIVGVTAVLGIFFLFIVTAIWRGRHKQSVTGREGLIGSTGVIRHKLNPEGYVFVQGALWRAASPLGELDEGTQVRVIGVEGLLLTVMPLAPGHLRTQIQHKI